MCQGIYRLSARKLIPEDDFKNPFSCTNILPAIVGRFFLRAVEELRVGLQPFIPSADVLLLTEGESGTESVKFYEVRILIESRANSHRQAISCRFDYAMRAVSSESGSDICCKGISVEL